MPSKRIEVFKLTRDNWYPSYALDGWFRGNKSSKLVNVIYNGNITAYSSTVTQIWRTCVWGGDDCGMEFDCDTEEKAWDMFLRVIRLEYVDKDVLTALGYVPA